MIDSLGSSSCVNILEVAPLFFLGSTLIFIGYDLMFEWLWEVRHQVFLSEYFIVWFTFISIHVVGIDFGILIGVLIAICDQIFTTAKTTGVNRVERRSRAIYAPEDTKLVQEIAYSTFDPKIVTLEVIGNLFFGSSLSLLNRMYEEIGMSPEAEAAETETETHESLTAVSEDKPASHKTLRLTKPPKCLVLDLMGVTHLDASATRGCFLQLVKKASKKGVVICATGVSPKIEWMFRAHGVGFGSAEEEEEARDKLGSKDRKVSKKVPDQIFIFTTTAEALEFCETLLLQKANGGVLRSSSSFTSLGDEQLIEESKEHAISRVLAAFLGSSKDEAKILDRLMSLRYHSEVIFKSGKTIFEKNGKADAFYIVLNGSVANSTAKNIHKLRQQEPVFSGAGVVPSTSERYKSGSGMITTLWQTGGIFGFNDYILERPRTFMAVAQVDGTKIAKFTHSQMNALQTQDPELFAIVQKALLRASNLDLANSTDHDV